MQIRRLRLRLLPWLLLLILGLSGARAFARVDPPHPAVDPRAVDGTRVGGVVDLSSTWLLHAQTGSAADLQFADPNISDADWQPVIAGRSLASYGLKNVNIVWYRTHVRLDPATRDLSLLLRQFSGSETVFANGVRIGDTGVSPPGGTVRTNSLDRVYRIPNAVLGSGALVIAIRAEIGRISEAGTRASGMQSYSAMFLGDSSIIEEKAALYAFRAYTSNSVNLALELLLLLITAALAVSQPAQREYLALGVYLTARALIDIWLIWMSATDHENTLLTIYTRTVLQAVAPLALLEFVRLVLGIRRGKLFIYFEWSYLLLVLAPGGWLVGRMISGPIGWQSRWLVIFNVFAEIIALPLDVGLPVLALWVWWKRRNRDALLLAVPLIVQALVYYYHFVAFIIYRLHPGSNLAPYESPVQALYVQWSEITQMLFSVALMIFLVLRTIRIARDRATIAAEIHAAQTVQQLLLTRASQPTPGFTVETVYHPANEVGGDFFLVSPGPDGSLTAIVGDVSGKGLLAAMRVSMILGVLRREDSRDPAAILAGLNDVLLSQGEMGFTTACCVRLDRSGHITVANAGHLSPYLDGGEVPTAPALPLGLVAGQAYELTHAQLNAGQRLVLLSDGVVEARSQAGELYGFDRMSELTLQSADQIAAIAQNFGQEDDITVLTIACGSPA